MDFSQYALQLTGQLLGYFRVSKRGPGRPGNTARRSDREFFDRSIADLGRPGKEAERARRMLERYAPEGPGRDAKAQAWADWWRANSDYLFFGEAGGYRWYLDPLAKARGVPTAQLRGPAPPAVNAWRRLIPQRGVDADIIAQTRFGPNPGGTDRCWNG